MSPQQTLQELHIIFKWKGAECIQWSLVMYIVCKAQSAMNVVGHLVISIQLCKVLNKVAKKRLHSQHTGDIKWYLVQGMYHSAS